MLEVCTTAFSSQGEMARSQHASRHTERPKSPGERAKP
jgi:hypothetical protein